MSTSSNTEVADLTMTLSSQAHKKNSVNGVDELQVQRRYDEERTKRIRDEGDKQYVDISLSKNFKKFGEDPWINPSTVKDAREMFPDNRCQMFILGAGLGGILYAVRMIQAGFRPEDIRIVDRAGGFGGTWYHNRYPGLKCDIESYSYLPLLEETGYMPKYRYSSGEEIRNYANLIAEKYSLVNSAVFLTKAEALVWNDAAKSWDIEISQTFPGKPSQNLNIQSQFVCTVPGFSHWPKFPDLPGGLDYQGDIFHTSRWNYSVTGGSEADPSLTKLRDKRVAIIGTGATAVQVVPQLAKWAKHLFVVQRTPSAVDERNNHATDPSWFKKEVATSSSWQRERLRNFHQHFTTGERPKANLVNDNWKHSSLVALTGDPAGPKTLEEFPAYLQLLHSLDLSHQAKLRQRVVDIVQDEKTAEGLKAWYPSWCKRPCFHDEYLTTFNRANVTLVDTEGRGPDGLTGKSVVVGDQKYKVDGTYYSCECFVLGLSQDGEGFSSPNTLFPPYEEVMLIFTLCSHRLRHRFPRSFHRLVC